MAEGGDDSQDNPFSFKKFVKKQSDDESPISPDDGKEDEEDVFDLPDLGVEVKPQKERSKLVVTDGGSLFLHDCL